MKPSERIAEIRSERYTFDAKGGLFYCDPKDPRPIVDYLDEQQELALELQRVTGEAVSNLRDGSLWTDVLEFWLLGLDKALRAEASLPGGARPRVAGFDCAALIEREPRQEKQITVKVDADVDRLAREVEAATQRAAIFQALTGTLLLMTAALAVALWFCA